MHDFTSKELYMANGGQKRYIYSDGFGDVYKATPEEEARWAAEIVTNALVIIEKETNRTLLESAISNLEYHNYTSLEALLLNNIHDTNPARQIVFATALRKITANTDTIEKLKKILNVT